MNRRSFLKYAGVASTAASVAGTVGLPSEAMARRHWRVQKCQSYCTQ